MTKMLGKMTDLGNHIISGLMANPTLTTETIVVFVAQHTKEAIKFMTSQEITEDIDIIPGMNLEKTESRMSKLEKTFKVQEGAAKGSSICRSFLLSQTEGR